METEPGNVLAIDELSDCLRGSHPTLCKLAQEGRVPCRTVGGLWRFQKKTIDRWLGQGGATDMVDIGDDA